jgi:outer membrane protein OmpA-like peptidoglycan-associated protein
MTVTGLFGLVGMVHAQEAATAKTMVKGNSGYFEYGIYQEQKPSLPFVTCVGVDECPARTTKTLVDRTPPKTVTPIQSSSEPASADTDKVYFNFASAQLTAAAKESLTRQVESLKGHKVITLRGWTDPVGGMHSQKNRQLAKARAQSVKGFLKMQGIKAHFRLQYNPPCCSQKGVTAQSSDQVRQAMRVVEVIKNDQ